MSNQRDSTILIVDDDAGVRETLESILEVEGYSTAGAANGKEALDYLQKSRLPCLILLDLVMPVMNGFKFREAQLFDPFLEFIPVLLLSADASIREHAETMRVAGFLTKPVDVQKLFVTVRAH